MYNDTDIFNKTIFLNIQPWGFSREMRFIPQLFFPTERKCCFVFSYRFLTVSNAGRAKKTTHYTFTLIPTLP